MWRENTESDWMAAIRHLFYVIWVVWALTCRVYNSNVCCSSTLARPLASVCRRGKKWNKFSRTPCVASVRALAQPATWSTLDAGDRYYMSLNPVMMIISTVLYAAKTENQRSIYFHFQRCSLIFHTNSYVSGQRAANSIWYLHKHSI